jgi:hypothetical protein
MMLATIGFSGACARAEEPSTQVASDDPAAKFVVGHLDTKIIPESSGIVASRKHKGVFWTHNDSGNEPRIFAIDASGRLLATYEVQVRNDDWEDIATDNAGHLFISETGNNARWATRQPTVYQLDEPDPSKPVAQAPLKITARYVLRYSKDAFDCEALFIWKDYGYLISKNRNGGFAQMYRFPLVERAIPVFLDPVTPLPIRAPVTAADMSADGNDLLVLTVFGPSRFAVKGDLAAAGKVTPRGVTFMQPDMEGATLTPKGVLATTESGYVLLFTNAMFDNPAKAGVDKTTHIDVTPAAKPIEVDGNLDDWDLARAKVPLKFDPPDSPEAARSHLWTSWTDKGLYVAAKVAQGDPAPLSDEWFGGDVVEIFTGPQSASRLADYGEGDNRCYVGFSAGADGKRGAVKLVFPRRSEPVKGALAAGHINEDGTYQIEVFLPAASLALEKPLQAEQEIRFNVSILARKPRRNWYVSESNSAGTWMSPLKWAIATLKKE